MNEAILNTLRERIWSWEHREGDLSNDLSATQTKINEYKQLLADFGFEP